MSIWKYADLYNTKIREDSRLEVGAGETALQKISGDKLNIPLETISLKREDQNPTGSHKDRGVTYQISAHLQEGVTEFVMSSSGNSVIAALNCANHSDIKLHLYLSNSFSQRKRDRITQISGVEPDPANSTDKFMFNLTDRPKSAAFKFAKENNLVFLRGSTDKHGTEGYKSLAFELMEQDPTISDIFIPTSSGTTAVGIYHGLLQKDELGKLIKMPRIHIVQTTKINAIAKEFDQDFITSESSIADSIVDRVAHRKNEVVDLVYQTNGAGWVVSDEEIRNSLKALNENSIYCSAEGAMAVAAIKKAQRKSPDLDNPVAILTGTA